MRAVILQVLGVICLVTAAALFVPVLGLVVLGIALLVFGTLEELH